MKMREKTFEDGENGDKKLMRKLLMMSAVVKSSTDEDSWWTHWSSRGSRT